MAGFDLSLLNPLQQLGSRILGDTIAPGADTQAQRLNQQRMAQADQIRKMRLPGLLTATGMAPTQARAAGAAYQPIGMPGGTGTSIAKGVAGGAMAFLPQILQGLGVGGSESGGVGTKSIIGQVAKEPIKKIGEKVAGVGVPGYGALGKVGGAVKGGLSSVAGALPGSLPGAGAALGGLGTTIPIVGGVVGAALLAKKLYGNGADRKAANAITGAKTGSTENINPNNIHAQFQQAMQTPGGPEKYKAVIDQLAEISRIDKDHYYQAQKTFRDFNKWTNGAVPALLG